jgi:hypothetical protein
VGGGGREKLVENVGRKCRGRGCGQLISCLFKCSGTLPSSENTDYAGGGCLSVGESGSRSSEGRGRGVFRKGRRKEVWARYGLWCVEGGGEMAEE